MRIALASDFHLDLRQFNRQQRWLDYVNTFVKVTKRVGELSPDAYVIAGDLFEKYRPHPGVIRRFLQEMSCLDCPIILIRGNHDSPQIFFERYGGDILHLLQDVAEIVYLNRENPSYELGDVCFIGLGYVGFNTSHEIARHVKGVKTELKTTVGVFHQLLDYPGVPENLVEVSRSVLKGLGLDYVLMGHWHVRYEEAGLFNPGSPEYWSFDQGEQVVVNLDTGDEKRTPAKEKGFYLIDTEKDKGEFIEVAPARPMYCVTFETSDFDEASHLPTIKRYLDRFNLEGTMVKTIIQGKLRYGRINLRRTLNLEKPLIHNVVTNLKSAEVAIETVDTIEAQAAYLADRGVSKDVSKRVAEWLEHSRDDLAAMQSRDLLRTLRAVLRHGEVKDP
jgi:DNA repair exonuclease SbcCD nuclease subunit